MKNPEISRKVSNITPNNAVFFFPTNRSSGVVSISVACILASFPFY